MGVGLSSAGSDPHDRFPRFPPAAQVERLRRRVHRECLGSGLQADRRRSRVGLGWGLSGWAAAGLAALIAWRVLGWRMEAVARACHELRGPLTAARLGLELGAREGSLTSARLAAIDLELARASLALDDLASPRATGVGVE